LLYVSVPYATVHGARSVLMIARYAGAALLGRRACFVVPTALTDTQMTGCDTRRAQFSPPDRFARHPFMPAVICGRTYSASKASRLMPG